MLALQFPEFFKGITKVILDYFPPKTRQYGVSRHSMAYL